MWFLISGVAVLAAVAVGIAGEAMRPKSPGPRVLTDGAFVKAANRQCDATLPGLRPQDSGPFGTAVTPAQTADQIDQAAAGLDKLAGQLRIVPASPADQPHIDGWLDGWHRYASLGRQYAAFLRQHGSANPGPLLAASVNAAKAADNFALANGLKSCTFFVVPQPDPSNEF